MKSVERIARDEVARLEAELANDPRTRKIKAWRALLEEFGSETETSDEPSKPKVRRGRKPKATAKVRKAPKPRKAKTARARLSTSPSAAKREEVKLNILNAIMSLNERGERVTFGDIGAAAGCSGVSARKYCDQLVEAGRLKIGGGGKGRVAEFKVLSKRGVTLSMPDPEPASEEIEDADPAKREADIIAAITTMNAMGERVTYGAVAEVVESTAMQVKRDIGRMVKAGKVRITGNRGGTKFEVVSAKSAPIKLREPARQSPKQERAHQAPRAIIEPPEEAREVVAYLRSSGRDVEVTSDGGYLYHGEWLELPDLIDRANRQRAIDGAPKFAGGRPKAA